jgi:hypothetical protein
MPWPCVAAASSRTRPGRTTWPSASAAHPGRGVRFPNPFPPGTYITALPTSALPQRIAVFWNGDTALFWNRIAGQASEASHLSLKTLRLTEDQARLCEEWIANHRKLKGIVRRMEAMSLKETDRLLRKGP